MSWDEMTRRDFIKRAAALGAAVSGLSALDLLPGSEGSAEAAGGASIVVASKRTDPAALVRAAVNGMGGMKRFVKKGQTVVIKPNMGWSRKPEFAATSNPQIVAEVVRMCREAGAREVKVIDHPVDAPVSIVMKTCGIPAAVQAVGGRVIGASSPAMYERIDLRRGKVLKNAQILRDLRHADVFINLPIAKVHSSTVLTLGCKNLMGTVLDRAAWHNSRSLDQCIADFANEVRPHLTILDAYRILLTNGPKGPGRTADKHVVIAGTDPMAVDAYGCTLFGKKAQDITHLRLAAAMGVGVADLKRIQVKNV